MRRLGSERHMYVSDPQPGGEKGVKVVYRPFHTRNGPLRDRALLRSVVINPHLTNQAPFSVCFIVGGPFWWAGALSLFFLLSNRDPATPTTPPCTCTGYISCFAQREKNTKQLRKLGSPHGNGRETSGGRVESKPGMDSKVLGTPLSSFILLTTTLDGIVAGGLDYKAV